MEAQRPEATLGNISDLASYTANIRDTLKRPTNVPRLPRFYDDPFAFGNRPYMPGFQKAKKEHEEAVREIEALEKAEEPKKLKAAQEGIELLVSSQYQPLRELLEQESRTNTSQELRKYLQANLVLASRGISPQEINEKLPRLVESLRLEIKDTELEEVCKREYGQESGYSTCQRLQSVPYGEVEAPSKKAKKAYEQARNLYGLYKIPSIKEVIEKFEMADAAVKAEISEILGEDQNIKNNQEEDGCLSTLYSIGGLALFILLASISMEGCKAGCHYLFN